IVRDVSSTGWRKPPVPAGWSPSLSNSPATYSAALRCPGLPVSRPSSEASARNTTCDHQRRPSGVSAARAGGVTASTAIPNAAQLVLCRIDWPPPARLARAKVRPDRTPGPDESSVLLTRSRHPWHLLVSALPPATPP